MLSQSPNLAKEDAVEVDMTQTSLPSTQRALPPPKNPIQTKADAQSGLTNALLRDYRAHLDPLNTSDASDMDRKEINEANRHSQGQALSSKASPQESQATLPSSPPFSTNNTLKQISPPRSSPSSNKPHRSMLKALASRSSNENLRRQANSSYTNFPDIATSKTPFAARLAHLPCFFHQRFDDAINVERVLEEVAAETDGMSHTRLLQTATSVREISKQLQRRPIKRAVRNIMIITKARDNRLVYLTRELAEWLLSKPRYNTDIGVTVYVDAKLAKSKRFDAAALLASNSRFESMLRYWTPDLCWSSPEKFDLVITLGGDGTVLYTSWLFQQIVPPILPFSLGSLGFLTNFPFATYKPALDRIMDGVGMRVNMRMRFTCTVYRSTRSRRSRTSSAASTVSSRPSKVSTATSAVDTPSLISDTTSATQEHSDLPDLVPDGTYQVLNELVLDRGPSPYVSNLELYSNNYLLTIIQADGCIISTPTGSTAYSLSAGGPLTHPSIPGILLTPICPHTLSFRPMVLSDTLMLRLVVPRNSRSTAYASFDGKGRVELRRGDEVRVEAGRYPFPTVVGEGGEEGKEWFDSVQRALRWNTRGVVQGGFGSKDASMEKVVGYANGAEKQSRMAAGLAGKLQSIASSPDGAWEGEEDDQFSGGEDEAEEEWDINPDPTDQIPHIENTSRRSSVGTGRELGSAGASALSLHSMAPKNTIDPVNPWQKLPGLPTPGID